MTTGTPFSPAPFSTSVVAPGVLSANRARPYISVTDYRNAPTAVSTTALVSGSTNPGDSTSALARVIERASSWADLICFHRADGTLAASPSTESAWVTAKSGGALALICNYRPVLEVVGLGLGSTPSQLGNVSPSTAGDIFIDGKVIWVPGWWNYPAPGGGLVPLPRPLGVFGQLFAVWTYINGYPHTALSANCNAAATSITVYPSSPGGSTVAGVYAGTQLTINDGDNTEIVVAASAPTGLNITLAAPTQFAHTIPQPPDVTRVSALPRAVEQAVILLTSCLIKTRGSRALVMPGTPGGTPNRQVMGQAGASEDYEQALELLKPFVVATLRAA